MPKKKVSTSESTQQQAAMHKPVLGIHNHWPIAHGDMYASGGTWSNPCAIPGYGRYYRGTYETYRLMLSHPVIALAKSMFNSPVIASEWHYHKRNASVPDQWLDAVRNQMDPLRQGFVSEIVRGRDYGFQPFEIIWTIRDGQNWIDRFKPLSVDQTTILTDRHGRFVGVQNGEVRLSATDKAWAFTYDGEAGNLYGRSFLENIRDTAWKDWLDCLQQLQRLGNNISGSKYVAVAPAGVFQDESGNDISFHKHIADMLNKLVQGSAGVVLPSLFLQASNTMDTQVLESAAALAKASAVSLNRIDFGSSSPAIAGLIERMKHDESMMFNGCLLPSRVGLEATLGTKAESETMTETSIITGEVFNESIAYQLQPVVDMILTTNFGDVAKGAIRLSTPPLIDRRVATLKQILLGLVQNPENSASILKIVNLRELAHDIDIPLITSDDTVPDVPIEGNPNASQVQPQELQPDSQSDPKRAGEPDGQVGKA